MYSKILIGLLLGAIVGTVANVLGLEWLRTLMFAIEPLGTAFIRMITMIVLTATLASIGSAGVPAAGIIILIVVLQSVGLGPQAQAGIALLLGIDRIPDMLRTSCNVIGDLVAASSVARSEGETLEPPAENDMAEVQQPL